MTRNSIRFIVFTILCWPIVLFAATDTQQLLEKLSNAHAAPGFEQSVRQVLYPVWKKDLQNFKVDGIGNVSGTLRNQSATPNVLLMSHMDEVAYLVRTITDDGYIQVEPLGGWRDQVVYAQRWLIMTNNGPVLGYSGEESGHIVPRGNQATNTKANSQLHAAREMYIDVGATSKQDAMQRLHIRPGLPITPDTQFAVLNKGSKYLGKAFDDRVGLLVLTQLIKQFSSTSHPNQLTFAATVQEEVGLRGAEVIANEFKPDVVVNVEVCIAGDHPFTATPSNASYPALGKGPCVYVYERSMIPNNKMVDWVADLARKNNIPLQFATAPNYGQDGAKLQRSGMGVPTIVIGIPLRYAHQQAGVVDQSDIANTIKLMSLMITNMTTKQVNLFKPV